jgi:Ca2+-transporting ATPase
MEDSTPAMALAMDEVDEGVMNEPARRPNEPILDRKSVISIAVYAVVMNFVLLGMFYYFYQLSFGNIVYARTITFIGLGIASLFTIYSARALKTSIFKLNPFSNPWLITTTILGAALLLIAVYVPMVNNILQTTPLGLTEWIILICYALFGLTMYESLKRL